MTHKTIPIKHTGKAYHITVKVHDKPQLHSLVRTKNGLIKMRAFGLRLQRVFVAASLKTKKYLHKSAGKKVIFQAGVILSLGLLGTFSLQVVAYAHTAVEIQPIVNHAHNKPVRIAFNRVVRGSLSYAWQENIAGSWLPEKTFAGVRALVFTPKDPLTPGSVLHLKLKNVQPTADIMSNTPSEQLVAVVVERAAAIVSQTPAINAQQVRVSTELSLKLSTTNRGLRTFVLAGDIPVVSPKPSGRDDTVFSWKLAGELAQGKTYHAEVRDTQQTEEKQVVAVFHFTTVAEPSVSTNVSGYIKPNQTITVDFDQDMVQHDKAVVFAMPGKGAWQGSRQYAFTTSFVVPGTTYSYKVISGTQSVHGGALKTDKIFNAQTPGAVKVVGSQPSGSRIPLNNSVKITFDQPVDHASAENAFSISPQVNGSFSWSGNTMIFTPSSYGYQTTYTYAVAPGIKPVFGLMGVGYSKQFITVYEVRKLNVPFFRQAHALSCEAASLRMALAYYGVGTSDDEILGRIGYAPQPRDTATNTWQDPNVEFVGDVNGKINVTGWGVYAGPVARAAQSFGRSADVIYSPSAASVASAIYAGRPVIMWGVMGTSAIDDSWNTATSGVVHAAKNQHVRLVYGVEGSAENPAGFYLNDPLRGSVYLTAGALQASMNAGGRQILVVY
ncbi:C39 family peptidase [Candidatus Saccharibacteria bacterium]|nr:MAG: C39 family peptidase [Candidatus Saccharibacteria bacterium]